MLRTIVVSRARGLAIRQTNSAGCASASSCGRACAAVARAPPRRAPRAPAARLTSRWRRDGALARGGHQCGVLREHAVVVARRRRRPVAQPLRDLVVGEVDAQLAGVDVDRHHLALLEDGDRTTAEGLGDDVADHEPVRRAGEAAVGDQRDVVAEPFADDRAGDLQHLGHPGPAGRALVADHDHVAGLDRLRHHGVEGGLLGVEHARRAAVHVPVDGQLDHAAVGREIAAQDPQRARSA